VPGCPCVWVARIANHGSVLLSRGWLITVEAPGHPRHPPSTQLDAVANGLMRELQRTEEKNKSLPRANRLQTFQISPYLIYM